MATVACRALRQTEPRERRSRPVATPSNDAPSQAGAGALAMEGQTDHRGLRQVRCGTAKEGYRPYRTARRLAVPPSKIRAARALQQAVRRTPRMPRGAFQSARFLA